MESEIWLPVPGHEKRYEVSSLGRVRSLDTMVPHKLNGRTFYHKKTGKILKQYCHRGYMYVNFGYGAKNRHLVHRVVCGAFWGDGDGLEVNHKDFNRSNNKVQNLEWVSRRENLRHNLYSGRHNKAKLTKAQADQLRTDVATRKSHIPKIKVKDIAKKYGISYAALKAIIRGESWA